MCYLIAKRFEDKGCIAVKTRHGKPLADFAKYLQNQVAGKSIQLVTISDQVPMENMNLMKLSRIWKLFQEKVLMM